MKGGTIEMPGADAEMYPDPESDEATSSLATADILVVDDAPENLLAIQAALGDLGGALVCAQSGAEALRYLLHRDFALILLDVEMPGLDGFETARMIRARPKTQHVPIIFVTAHDRDAAQVLHAYRLGAVDFLFKPIDADVLQAKASVFVDLQRRTAQVAAQAELLREHERRAHLRELAEQRHQLEEEALRRRLLEETRHTEQLAQTIAELESTQTELERANAQLAEADRRKDEFLAVLAHELRNPLAPLVAGLELFSLAELDDPMLVSTKEAMQRQVMHLGRLVDDLLDISRIASGKIELQRVSCDLADVLEQAVAIARPLLDQKQHSLHCSLSPAATTINADPVRLAQVVANLLSNAARYTDPGGNISLECELEGDVAVVRVTDDGQGMPKDLVDRVFDVFVQEQTSGPGLGLGLTLVRRLAELHGGSAHAASDGPGCGASFEVRLPIVDSAPPAEAAPARPTPAPCQEPLRVVLIEDNDDIRALLQQVLEKWGHCVSAAPNGQSGIETVLRERPDVALVDIGLPDMDGYDVAERVRSELLDGCPRLVALSGFSQAADRKRAREAGFDTHLAKPASGESLRRVLYR